MATSKTFVTPLLAGLFAFALPAALATDLHRADFRVEGSSCAACLRRVSKKLHAAPGVVKADVSIFRPYWGLVIYDAEKTTVNKVFDAAKDERVTMAELEDTKIAEVPTIVIPKTGPGKTPLPDANLPPGLQAGAQPAESAKTPMVHGK